jgi:hypothetical protein
VTRFQQRLATGEYHVNADAVAQEMLSKLRLVDLGRRALVPDPVKPGGPLPLAAPAAIRAQPRS